MSSKGYGNLLFTEITLFFYFLVSTYIFSSNLVAQKLNRKQLAPRIMFTHARPYLICERSVLLLSIDLYDTVDLVLGQC